MGLRGRARGVRFRRLEWRMEDGVSKGFEPRRRREGGSVRVDLARVGVLNSSGEGEQASD